MSRAVKSSSNNNTKHTHTRAAKSEGDTEEDIQLCDEIESRRYLELIAFSCGLTNNMNRLYLL